MTSDAKIGLLLGLVFIFIIAFIINGLPDFHSNAAKENNQLTQSLTSLRRDDLGLGTEHQFSSPTVQISEKETPKAESNEPPVVEQVQVAVETPLPNTTTPPEAVKENTIPAQKPKFYVVEQGDSLASIAKKCYGPELGNKTEIIERLYYVNKNIIKSQDDISIGQKILIPALLIVRDSSDEQYNNLTSNPVLTKVKSIGQRHDAKKISAPVKNKIYVVQENDSLWRIAANKLGDGKRFREIMELNKDILDGSDALQVGMSLKMPVN